MGLAPRDRADPAPGRPCRPPDQPGDQPTGAGGPPRALGRRDRRGAGLQRRDACSRVCADASAPAGAGRARRRPRALRRRRCGARRAGAGADATAARRAPADRARAAGVVLADWARLERDPGLAAAFEHVVLIDPPPFAQLERLVDRSGPRLPAPRVGRGRGRVRAPRAGTPQWPSRAALAASTGRCASWPPEPTARVAPAALRLALAGEGAIPAPPEVAGRCLRVLAELGLSPGIRTGRGCRARRRILGGDRPGAIARRSSPTAPDARKAARFLSRRRQPE